MLPLFFLIIPLFTLSCLHWLYRKIFVKAYNVEDKIVLVTGASSGLGEACAKKFSKEGAKVVLCARNFSELNRVKNEINCGETATWPLIQVLDITNADHITECVRTLKENYGDVDVLISNAGMSQRGSVCDSSIEVHKNLMNVNYFGPVNLVKAILPSMIERKQGHIVSVGSVQSLIAIPFRSAYSSSKHANQAFFDSLRAEVANDNINVTTINPGYIKTNLSLNALSPDGSKHGVMDKTTSSGMEASFVADKIFESVVYQENEIFLADITAYVGVCLRTLCPVLYHYVMTLRAKSERKKLKKNT